MTHRRQPADSLFSLLIGAQDRIHAVSRFGILLKGWGDAEIILEDGGDGAKFIRHLQEPVKETLKIEEHAQGACIHHAGIFELGQKIRCGPDGLLQTAQNFFPPYVQKQLFGTLVLLAEGR